MSRVYRGKPVRVRRCPATVSRRPNASGEPGYPPLRTFEIPSRERGERWGQIVGVALGRLAQGRFAFKRGLRCPVGLFLFFSSCGPWPRPSLLFKGTRHVPQSKITPPSESDSRFPTNEPTASSLRNKKSRESRPSDLQDCEWSPRPILNLESSYARSRTLDRRPRSVLPATGASGPTFD